MDYDPYGLYHFVASQESIRIIFPIAAAQDHILEGGEEASAYLYRYICFFFFMVQPTEYSVIKFQIIQVSFKNLKNSCIEFDKMGIYGLRCSFVRFYIGYSSLLLSANGYYLSETVTSSSISSCLSSICTYPPNLQQCFQNSKSM